MVVAESRTGQIQNSVASLLVKKYCSPIHTKAASVITTLFIALETSDDMADALCAVLPKDARIIRIHVSGDMFSHKYFMAWIKVAERNPDVLFYAYTKSLTYWVRSRDLVPTNLVLTASYGGRDDHLIAETGLRSAKVVFSKQEAADLGLEIDNDDSHACDPTKANQDFALLIHGVQPKGSKAAEALKILKKEEVTA